MQNKAIILTGMMGSGKTSTGIELARLLKCEFCDLDEIIEKKYGKISDIFKNKGEEYFRSLETKELKEILKKEELFVLSTGGGAVLKDENLQIIKNNTVFYLQTSANIIFERIKHQTHRPLLNTQNPKETIKNILNSRLKQYEKSGIKINTDNLSAKQIAGEIYEKLKG